MTGLDPSRDVIVEIATLDHRRRPDDPRRGPGPGHPPARRRARPRWTPSSSRCTPVRAARRGPRLDRDPGGGRAPRRWPSSASTCPSRGPSRCAGTRSAPTGASSPPTCPDIENFLHYRSVDVSSVKELVRRWYPAVRGRRPRKVGSHRALDDIQESVVGAALLPRAHLRPARPWTAEHPSSTARSTPPTACRIAAALPGAGRGRGPARSRAPRADRRARPRPPTPDLRPSRVMPGSTSTPGRTPWSRRPGGRAVVPTGVAVAIPEGYAGLVHAPQRAGGPSRGDRGERPRGRSTPATGTSSRSALLNTDPAPDHQVRRGDRIAQLVSSGWRRPCWSRSTSWRATGAAAGSGAPAASEPPPLAGASRSSPQLAPRPGHGSRTTSSASLSSRRPRKLAWRTSPRSSTPRRRSRPPASAGPTWRRGRTSGAGAGRTGRSAVASGARRRVSRSRRRWSIAGAHPARRSGGGRPRSSRRAGRRTCRPRLPVPAVKPPTTTSCWRRFLTLRQEGERRPGR